MSPLPSKAAWQKLPHVGPHPTRARGPAAWSVCVGLGGIPFPEVAPPGWLWPVLVRGGWGLFQSPTPTQCPLHLLGVGSPATGLWGPGLPNCRH